MSFLIFSGIVYPHLHTILSQYDISPEAPCSLSASTLIFVSSFTCPWSSALRPVILIIHVLRGCTAVIAFITTRCNVVIFTHRSAKLNCDNCIHDTLGKKIPFSSIQRIGNLQCFASLYVIELSCNCLHSCTMGDRSIK